MKLSQATNQAEWDAFVQQHAGGHPLQLWAWGEVKRLNGWSPLRFWNERHDEGAQMLLWPVPKTRLSLAYVPRGPLGRSLELLEALAAEAKNHGAIYLRLEPAWPPARTPKGWRHSSDHILLSTTYTIDLARSEDELQSVMRHKTRQYIRKAETEGIKVEAASQADFDEIWRIYGATAKRAGFQLHGPEYYKRLWTEAGENNMVLLAKLDGHPVAFLWLLVAGGVAFELYGGIDESGVDTKANYALKSEAIRQAKAAGAKLYDFNGRLNEGVGQFKSGFGPDETEWIGTLDKPLKPALYAIWQAVWPAGKKLVRLVRR